MPSATIAAARPAHAIVVPWPCVFFPSGLNRWRVPVTTPRKMVWTSIAREPSWTSTSAPAPGLPANDGGAYDCCCWYCCCGGGAYAGGGAWYCCCGGGAYAIG